MASEAALTTGPSTRPSSTVPRPDRLAAVAVVVAITAAGVLVPLSLTHPLLALGAAVAVAIALIVCVHPPAAVYLMLAVTPLVVGIDRDAGAAPIRSNEALLAVVVAGVALRGLWELLHGGALRWRPLRLDIAVLLLSGAAAVLPLVWLYGRTGEVAASDLQYAAVLLKYLVLYGLVRVTIRTSRQVLFSLVAVLAAAIVVAAVAIVQTLVPVDLPGWFATYYAPDGEPRLLEIGRGSSTLASSIAVGDHLAFALAVALAWLVRDLPGRVVVLAVTGVLAVGVLAAGQFSALIALVIAVVAVGWLTGSLRSMLGFSLPVVALGAVVAWPVIERRLVGFATPAGLPQSWLDRWSNLQTYFWPELADGGFWLGVRPEARVVAPEAWRDWIWIESGHTWLLWTGGLPLAAAYIWFAWCSFTVTRRRARLRGPVGVAAVAAFAATCIVFVLMAFDPHLTLRGAADLYFPLLALALVGAAAPGAAAPGDGAPPRTAHPDLHTTSEPTQETST